MQEHGFQYLYAYHRENPGGVSRELKMREEVSFPYGESMEGTIAQSISCQQQASE